MPRRHIRLLLGFPLALVGALGLGFLLLSADTAAQGSAPGESKAPARSKLEQGALKGGTQGDRKLKDSENEGSKQAASSLTGNETPSTSVQGQPAASAEIGPDASPDLNLVQSPDAGPTKSSATAVNATEDEAFEDAIRATEPSSGAYSNESTGQNAAEASELLRSIEGIRSMLKNARFEKEAGRFVVHSKQGPTAALTVEPALQQYLQRFLRRYDVPYAAVVAIEPATGKILAMVEHGVEPYEPGHLLEAEYPAASIFKIVTGAALLEAGISPKESVCYHGGVRRLALANLLDDPRRDHACVTLADAMGYSVNAAFGKLALRELKAEELREAAGRLHFNQPVPLFPPPSEVSTRLVSQANIPGDDDQLGFGRTAAGFGEVTLSPMHGALLASTVANGGLAAVPFLVGALEHEGGVLSLPQSEPSRWMSEEVASSLTEMLEITVSRGTARTAFLERRRPVLGSTRVAGKTGSLSVYGPIFRDYSWFIGFAPVESPQIAVGVVVVNPRKWIIKAPYIAREAMRVYLSGR